MSFLLAALLALSPSGALAAGRGACSRSDDGLGRVAEDGGYEACASGVWRPVGSAMAQRLLPLAVIGRGESGGGDALGPVVDFPGSGMHVMLPGPGGARVPFPLTPVEGRRGRGVRGLAVLSLFGALDGPESILPGEDDRRLDQRVYLVPSCRTEKPWPYEVAGVKIGFFRRLERSATGWTAVLVEGSRQIVPRGPYTHRRAVCDGVRPGDACPVRCMVYPGVYYGVQLHEVILPASFRVEESRVGPWQEGPTISIVDPTVGR